MKDKIPVTLNDNHMYSCAVNVIAYNNENDVSQLEITLDDRLLDYWVFIDFEKPDGTKIKTPKLNIVGNVATYVIPRSLVDIDGSLKAQIVLQNEKDVVWKSSIKTYRVKSSINATDDIPEQEKEDFITEAQKLLEEIKNSGGTGGSCLLTEVTITIDENGGEETIVPVTKLELDYTSVELEVGQGMQIACSVLPSNATNNAITWSSSDSTKVKVEEGYITALASGNATITAKSVENPSISASCLVTVPQTSEGGDSGEDTTVEVTSITLDKTNLNLKVDETVTLKATVLPTNATNKNVVWSSSDNSKATVNNGVVTALAEGNVTITARSQSNTSITATCGVTIEAKETGGGTGGETGQTITVDFNDLDIQTGLKKKDGSTVTTIDKTHYVEFPYKEGMFISTNMNAGWVSNYPAFMVYDGSAYNIPEYTKDNTTFTTTLTDYAEGSTVYVNIYSSIVNDVLNNPSGSLPLNNCYYTYTVGGAE